MLSILGYAVCHVIIPYILCNMSSILTHSPPPPPPPPSPAVNIYQMGKFHVRNGVRQGGVLSPRLFNVYVNELSECLNKSGIGGSMKGAIINHMLYMYADDICIISLSLAGSQQLLYTCSGYTVNFMI